MITILSRQIVAGTPNRWRFGITSWWAQTIINEPTALELQAISALVEVSQQVYTDQGYTGVPYGNAWFIEQVGYNYYINFEVFGPYFVDFTIEQWINFDGKYPTPPPGEYISLTYEPQRITPVYNPITFKFVSDAVTLPGYRYIFGLYNEDGTEQLASFRLSPLSDGSGYIDISKFLSLLSYRRRRR